MGSWIPRVAMLCVLLLMAGCGQRIEGPNLVELHRLQPLSVGVGETLEIHGSGLPEGVPAQVVFEGSLHRAGQQAFYGARIVAEARPAAENRLSVLLGEQLYGEFCGLGERAEHTTFRGRLQAVFVPETPGAATVHGTLSGVVLDLSAGAASRTALRRRSVLARRAEAALGLEFGPDSGGEGLVVQRVKGDAAEAGLTSGDLLLELDGLRLRTLSDFRPTGRSPVMTLLVRRRGVADPIALRVTTQGLQQNLSVDRVLPMASAWLLALLLLFWLGPADRVATWIVGLARARLARSGPGGSALSVRPQLLVLLGALAAAITTLALGATLVTPTSDVWVVTAGVMAAMSIAGMVAGGGSPERGFRLWSGLVAAARSFLHQTPVALGVLAATLVGGSSSLHLLVQDQAGFAQNWAVFRNPGLLFSLVTVWFTLIPQPRRCDPIADDQSIQVRGSGLARTLDWVTVSTSCVLLSTLYLGGWALPWSAHDPTTPAAVVGGVVVFQLKCWLLVLSVAVVRRWAVRASVFELTGIWGRIVVPASVAALVLAWVWHKGVTAGPWADIDDWVSWFLIAMTLGVAILGGHRLLTRTRSRPTSLGVSPWI